MPLKISPGSSSSSSRRRRRSNHNNRTSTSATRRSFLLLRDQFLLTLKWLTLVVFVVTLSITLKKINDHTSIYGSGGATADYLLDLPICGYHGYNRNNNNSSSSTSSSTTSSGSTSSSSCLTEYSRVSTNSHTKGLTEIDLENSRALMGNRYRLSLLSKKLSQQKQRINAVVAGGSITLGHGVEGQQELRYSARLEAWMNQYYPIISKSQGQLGGIQHRVFNVGTHGADMCAMAKRINIMIQNLPVSKPDLFVLEFAVNDYQGQDHKLHLDHKTDVFFEKFEELVICAEVVVYRLLTEFPSATIMFLEFQTAIANRKTAATLHMAVAKHYQIPVISYAETMFPDYQRLLNLLEPYDYSTATLINNNNNNNNHDATTTTTTSTKTTPFTGDPVLPYPHGCVPCLDQYIIPDFRDKGCKSLCVFAKRSGNDKLNCNEFPPGREPCYVSFLAHDAVHPSKVGHQIAADLLAEAIARTGREICEGRQYPGPQILPTLGLMVPDPKLLSKKFDFLLVKDTMDGFGTQRDELTSTSHSDGFRMFGDFRDRPGWIATNPAGNEYVEFEIDLLPQQQQQQQQQSSSSSSCYVVYLAVLKSYENMGTFTVTVIDELTRKETTTTHDGLWKPRISVPSDFPITSNTEPGCTGRCKVLVRTNPQIEGRGGNKVKVVTLSARKCVGEQKWS